MLYKKGEIIKSWSPVPGKLLHVRREQQPVREAQEAQGEGGGQEIHDSKLVDFPSQIFRTSVQVWGRDERFYSANF